MKDEMKVLLGVSNRHVHLNREDMDILFGPGSELTNIRDLVQPGQYACAELVTLVGPKGSLEKVRVLGPLRKQTQAEVSVTDTYKLGVPAVVRDSGLLGDTPGVVIVGPRGAVIKQEGVIVASRHLHLATAEAEQFGVKDGDRVSIVVQEGERPVTFGNVLVRVSDQYSGETHLDLDEANAAFLKSGMMVTIRK